MSKFPWKRCWLFVDKWKDLEKSRLSQLLISSSKKVLQYGITFREKSNFLHKIIAIILRQSFNHGGKRRPMQSCLYIICYGYHLHRSRYQRRYNMNGGSQMLGGKNWILPKEINANRFFRDSHWLEIWTNHLCPSMVPNEGSVAMDLADSSWVIQQRRLYIGLLAPPCIQPFSWFQLSYPAKTTLHRSPSSSRHSTS
jgi:hypothetical protein